MSNDRHNDFAAAVMAGGRSTRMGCDKAFLKWQGHALIERQLDLLRQLQPQQLFISGRGGVDYGQPEIEVIIDETADCGPMGGLATLLGVCRTSHLLILAVDLPYITLEFLKELIARATPGQATVPRLENRWEPLAALYPKTALPCLQSCLQSGQRSLRAFIDALAKEQSVQPIEVAPHVHSLFQNWNRPEDLSKFLDF